MSEVRDAMYDNLRHRVRNAVKRHDEARHAELIVAFNVWRLVDEQALLTEDTAAWWSQARAWVHSQVDAVLGVRLKEVRMTLTQLLVIVLVVIAFVVLLTRLL